MKRSGLLKRKTRLSRKVRIGHLVYTLPPRVSGWRRDLAVYIAEDHALRSGELTLAQAVPLIKKREQETREFLRSTSKRSRYSARPRDTAFMMFVKTQPCAAAELDLMPWLPLPRDARTASAARCDGPIEADHMGRRPVGRKAADDTCVPLCKRHHVARTGHSGLFRDATQEQLRAWTSWWIAEIQRRYAMSY